jgi:hypothetical protein
VTIKATYIVGSRDLTANYICCAKGGMQMTFKIYRYYLML